MFKKSEEPELDLSAVASVTQHTHTHVSEEKNKTAKVKINLEFLGFLDDAPKQCSGLRGQFNRFLPLYQEENFRDKIVLKKLEITSNLLARRDWLVKKRYVFYKFVFC